MNVAQEYALLLERAIIELRYRIRYNDHVTIDEVHDYLDSLHNIPPMLRGAGDWFRPENIDADLQRYDNKWLNVGDGAERRRGLLEMLRRIRAGEWPAEERATGN